MKFSTLLLAINALTLSVAYCTHENDFTIILEPQWQNLDQNTLYTQTFGGKWILAGTIIFKKKAKETVYLSQLQLRWKGTHLEKLIASLYRKDYEKKFLAIQENLVCDGCWNKTKQILTLNFDKKEMLGPTNIYELVLTVPEELELAIRKGSFELLTQELPEQFSICARQKKLLLTYTNNPQSIKTAYNSNRR